MAIEIAAQTQAIRHYAFLHQLQSVRPLYFPPSLESTNNKRVMVASVRRERAMQRESPVDGIGVSINIDCFININVNDN